MQVPAKPSDGERLRSLLEALDLTNADAARICGVAEATLYRWLGDKGPIPPMALRMFALIKHLQAAQPLLSVSWSHPDDELQDRLDGITVEVEV